MDEIPNNNPNEEHSTQDFNDSPTANSNPFHVYIKKKWSIVGSILYLIGVVISSILNQDIPITASLLITLVFIHYAILYHKKLLRLIIFIFFGTVFLIIAILRFVSIINQPDITNSQQQFAYELDDSIDDILIFLIRNNNPIDSLPDMDSGFEINSRIGYLHIRVKVPDKCLVVTSQYERFSIWTTASDSLNYNLTQNNFSQFVNGDTFFIPIHTLGVKNVPFEKIRDFQAQYFSPLFQENLLPYFDECCLVVNGWVILRCDLRKAHWRQYIISWHLFDKPTKLMKPLTSDFHGKYPPSGLWQIDLHNPIIQKL